jgi:O-antigen ligase
LSLVTRRFTFPAHDARSTMPPSILQAEHMNSETMDVFFERGILALVLAVLAFAPLALGGGDVQFFLVIQGLIMAVMLLWALRILFTPRPRFFWPPLCWAVLAFALYAVARYLTADIEYVARFEMIQAVLYAFLFFAIVNNLTSKESANIIVFALIILAAGISCYGAWQFMKHTNMVWDMRSPYPGRATGTYISPNNFACFLEMLLPLALAYLLTGRIRPMTRIFLGYAAVVMGTALAMTFSRGGWVAAAVGVFALLAVLICNRKHWLPALVLMLALIGGGTLFVTQYLSGTISYMERVKGIEGNISGKNGVDLEYRAPMWQAAEQMWKENFWFGVGPGHYDYRFREYRAFDVQARPGHAHNDYLNLLADWGTIGGIIVAAGMLLFAAGLIKTLPTVWPASNEFGRGMSNRFALFVGATAALLALAAHSVIDFNLHIPANALIGVALLALLTGQLRGATQDYRMEAQAPGKMVSVLVLVCGLVYFGLQGYWSAGEYYWRARSQNTNLVVLDRAALLEKAFAFEPKNSQTAYDIGELYRIQSFQGGEDNEAQAQTAMQWYQRGMKLDRFEGYNYLRTGMCLDWLGRGDESWPYYSKAEALDPNGYYTVAFIGWHFVQVRDYAAARAWLERSIRLETDVNPISYAYWDEVESKLTENASGNAILLPGY